MSDAESHKIGQPVGEYLSNEEKAHKVRILAMATANFNDAVAKAEKTGLTIVVELNDNKVSARVKS